MSYRKFDPHAFLAGQTAAPAKVAKPANLQVPARRFSSFSKFSAPASRTRTAFGASPTTAGDSGDQSPEA